MAKTKALAGKNREVFGKSPDVDGKSLDFPGFPLPAAELLVEGLKQLDIPALDSVLPVVGTLRGTTTLIPLIQTYLRELELFNAVFDLVGAVTGTDEGRCDLVVRHVLDSLAPWKEISRILSESGLESGLEWRPALADVGSGAGFPGIPLALLFPDIRVSLIERMTKRCSFLDNCKAILGLSNVTVLNSSVEDAPANCFDVVAFRAFRPLEPAMVRALLRLVGTLGQLAAWKARREKIDEEMAGIASEIGRWEAVPVSVPFLDHEERHLVIISSEGFPNPLSEGSC